MRATRSLLEGLLDFIYPPLCALCAVRLVAFESELCDECRRAVLANPTWRCRLCGGTGTGAPPPPSGRCPLCPPLDAGYCGVLSAAPYAGEAARCVHLFKYHRRLEIGRMMAGMMVARLAEPILALEDRVSWVAPVPLHWRRRAWRGFNQAELLGRSLASAAHLSFQPRLLRRVRHTRMQVRVPAHRRADNVRGAFACASRQGQGIPGVLLVDDVVTSGHTVAECARVLRSAGCPEIWVASFARAGSVRAETEAAGEGVGGWGPE